MTRFGVFMLRGRRFTLLACSEFAKETIGWFALWRGWRTYLRQVRPWTSNCWSLHGAMARSGDERLQGGLW
jgi:hypothetical protein